MKNQSLVLLGWLVASASASASVPCPTEKITSNIKNIQLMRTCKLESAQAEIYKFTDGAGCLAIGKTDGNTVIVFDAEMKETSYGTMPRKVLYSTGLPKWDVIAMTSDTISASRYRGGTLVSPPERHRLFFDAKSGALRLHYGIQWSEDLQFRCK